MASASDTDEPPYFWTTMLTLAPDLLGGCGAPILGSGALRPPARHDGETSAQPAA